MVLDNVAVVATFSVATALFLLVQDVHVQSVQIRLAVHFSTGCICFICIG